MTRVVYTPRARRDLIRIVETIASDNRRAAIAFASRLERHCSLLATVPEMGRERPEIGRGVRSLVQGNYLIFYRWNLQHGRVDILCVRHSQRKLPRLGD